MAHDLRNPLGGITMASSLLLDGEQSPQERAAYVGIISRQASNLDRMVGDLLDTTRIEAGQLDLRMQDEDVVALVRDTMCLYQSTSQNHKIRLICPNENLFAYCDGVRIGQVLNNLVSNAVKYSPYGGTITLEVRQDDGNVLLSVTDKGMGIAPEELESIFEPFRRAKATRDIIPGIGLGLSVSRRIIEAHSGKIDAQSERGRGATFTIRFPARSGNLDSSNLRANSAGMKKPVPTPESQASLH